MKIRKCRINHMKNPIGYQMEHLVFSWETQGEVDLIRLIVKTKKELVADTGWKKLNPLAQKMEISLLPRTRYIWQVQAKKGNEIVSSEEQYFETGKMEERWDGIWISPSEEMNCHPLFRKKLELPSDEICSARLYICGLGLYEAYLDGEKIGEAYLTPGFDPYNLFAQVQTYDITKQLQLGKRQFSALVGDGWYRSRIQFESPERGFYGNGYRLIAEIHIDFADGSHLCIPTDESWEVCGSPILFSGIYDGEHRDDTEKTKSPILPAVKASPFSCALIDSLSVPVRIHEKFQPDIVKQTDQEILLDVRQNMAGIFSMRVHVPKGRKVVLQFGEVLQQGEFYRDNLRTAKAEYQYVSDGRAHTIRPHFTYYGFRYVKITGLDHFEISDFTALALYSDVPMRGSIETGNAKLNQLISNVIWGMKSNFVDIPTDCPQRDERMGWTGDAQVFSETACWIADPYAFYRKYLFDLRREQAERGGCVPDIIPAVSMGQSAASAWGDAACIIPWNLYLYYGDPSILEEQYESMKNWVEYIRRIDGKDHGWRRNRQYGDWLALDGFYGGAQETAGGTDEGFIADVYYQKSTQILAQTAKILGKQDDMFFYSKLADKIGDGIRKEYYSATGRCCIDTQTAALLTINEKLNRTDRALAQLEKLLECSGNKLKTGFIGTPLLCQVLADHGMEKRAEQILLSEEYPGWLYEVKLGATTIWERWNSIREDGRISGTGMNSLNHYAYGAILAFLWKGLAGLKPLIEKPGFREVKIEPYVSWKIKKIHAVYPSPAGEYEIAWEAMNQNHIYMKIKVPQNCKASVKLPFSNRKPFQVSGERWEETYRTDEPIASAHSLDETLQKLMGSAACRKLLEKELCDLEHLLSYTRPYPLRETLENLRYDSGFVKNLDEKLHQIVE